MGFADFMKASFKSSASGVFTHPEGDVPPHGDARPHVGKHRCHVDQEAGQRSSCRAVGLRSSESVRALKSGVQTAIYVDPALGDGDLVNRGPKLVADWWSN